MVIKTTEGASQVQISIRYVNGYWTIFSGPQPIISCASYERAVELVSL